MANAEHKPITGVWGQSPQRGPGAEPWSGGQGAKPPEAEIILVIGCPTEPANLAPFQNISYRKQCALLRSTGVRVGGGRVHGDPNPVIGGAVPPPGSAAYECHR